ncbi:uncharacterized protein LOC115075635 [Rhinatrema bivittatum]|uniref:uncharacterized protein LOC115075635 n=1 Tax=Rhinatrema bivittatum TaxID=194408 RepID=UPI00112C7139|nr:uncharacterized protein LOC115075635 [Rhinatrema bivittatum]
MLCQLWSQKHKFDWNTSSKGDLNERTALWATIRRTTNRKWQTSSGGGREREAATIQGRGKERRRARCPALSRGPSPLKAPASTKKKNDCLSRPWRNSSISGVYVPGGTPASAAGTFLEELQHQRLVHSWRNSSINGGYIPGGTPASAFLEELQHQRQVHSWRNSSISGGDFPGGTPASAAGAFLEELQHQRRLYSWRNSSISGGYIPGGTPASAASTFLEELQHQRRVRSWRNSSISGEYIPHLCMSKWDGGARTELYRGEDGLWWPVSLPPKSHSLLNGVGPSCYGK